MKLEHSDWKILEALRAAFLSEDPKSRSQVYWTEKSLELYDVTFAKRIEAKWQGVVCELQSLGFNPAQGSSVLDWGCGTGVATLALLKAFPSISNVQLLDHSSLAKDFATRKIKKELPEILFSETEDPDILLISHVANELPPEAWRKLLSTIKKSTTVIWVEPGTPTLSRKLISVREELRSEFHVVAPCFHSQACGMLSPSQSSNWCHFPAPIPQEVFHSSFYNEFSKRLGIDLRSLPVSYLVLSKTFKPERKGGRVLAGSRFYKGYAQAMICEETGVSDVKLLERNKKSLISKLKQRLFCQSSVE